jgi:hypothetical protein
MLRRTPINPMSRKQRAKLAAAGITQPASTLVSRKVKAVKRPKVTGPNAETATLVAEREAWGCAVCGQYLSGPRGQRWSIHHRLRRSQGVDNSPANLLAVCGGAAVEGCHQVIHAAPAKAREGGWLLRSTDDPARCLVAHRLYGCVLLDSYGGVRDAALDGA